MLLTMKQLRWCILAEVERTSSTTYKVDSDDLKAALQPREHPQGRIRGVDFYVPLRFRNKWEQPQWSSGHQLYALVTKLKISPKDLLTTLKRPLVHDGMTFIASDTAKAQVFSMMATKIAGYFDDQVDVVTCPESSSTMAWELAEAVAAKLGGVPVVLDITRKKKGAEVEIDPDEWDEWVATVRKKGKDDAYIASTRKKAESLVKRWRKGGIPATKDVPHEIRKFLMLHTAGGSIDQVWGKRVLVIDDNVDKAETLRSIHKALRKAGASDVHLAAGWDYSQRKEQ